MQTISLELAIIDPNPAIPVKAVDATIGKYRDNATLQCIVSGVDSYKPMEWYFDNKKVPQAGDEDKYTIDANNNTLTVHGVRK
jgi:hypothetical protein